MNSENKNLIQEKINEENKTESENIKFVSFNEKMPDGTTKEAYGYFESSPDDSTIEERVEELRRHFIR